MQLLTSPVSLPVILAGIVELGNAIMPVLPTAWAQLIAGILAVIGLYYHNDNLKTGQVR
jgi:hypothetical protein